MSLAWIPNLLSYARIIGAPVMIAAASAQRATIFWVIVAISLSSDALDGFLARKLHVESEHGRMLDSWGDYVNLVALPVSFYLLWPDITMREAPWLALAIAAFFAHTVYAWLRFRIVPAYHTWGSKTVGPLLALSVVWMYAGGPAWPFHISAFLEVLVAADEFAIGSMLPGWSGAMPSSIHARSAADVVRRAPSAERRDPR